jgi:hypothetical protein
MRTDLFLHVKEEVGAFSAESGDKYLVIEEDYRNGNSDIYGYDLLSHEEFQIIDLTLRIFYNFAKGGRILLWKLGDKDFDDLIIKINSTRPR